MKAGKWEAKRKAAGLFAIFEGMPAHVLIILGLALTLLAPLILNFKGAALAGAQAEYDQLKTQNELDLEEFKRDQAERRKKSPELMRYNEATEGRKAATYDATMTPEQREALQKQEAEKDKNIQALKTALDDKDKEREKALQEKKEELDKKYDTIGIRREMAEAQTAVAGTRSHLLLSWLGRLLLIVGLLVLMLQSEGLRQKVVLVLLFIALIVGLSGVTFDLQGQRYRSRPMAMNVAMAAGESELAPSTRQMLMNKVWKLSGGARMQFKPEGKLVLMPPQEIKAENLNGTWELLADGKNLVITLLDKPQTLEIVALSERELKLSNNGQEATLTASDQ